VDSCGSEAGFERLPVELRKPVAAGTAADITETFYLMSYEKFQELDQLEIGMTDCEDKSAGGRRWRHRRVTQRDERILPKLGGVGKRAAGREL
jgi:hypothetical protein